MFLCKYSNSDSVCRHKDGPCSQRRPLSFCKSLSVRIYQLSPRATLSLTPVDQQTHCLSSRSPSFVGAELDPRLRGSRSQLIAADTLWSQLHAVPAWAPTSALVHVRCLLLCVVVVRVCMRELTRETDQQRERESVLRLDVRSKASDCPVCVCVCVCVCERESVCVCVCVSEHVCACERERQRQRQRESVCVCVRS